MDARLTQANLLTKTDFDTKLISLNKKINLNKTKHLLIENELKKLQTFYPIYFGDKSHFKEDGTKNYLVFQPMYRYIKRVACIGSGNHIYFWKPKGLSYENITPPTTTDYCFTPKFIFFGTKTRAEFSGSCLKQDKVTYNQGKVAHIYIVYEISRNYDTSSYSKLENSFFGAVNLTKNADIDKHKYSGYCTGFERTGFFSAGNGVGRNLIIFEVDMSPSPHIDLTKGLEHKGSTQELEYKGPTQRLEHTLTAEKTY